MLTISFTMLLSGFIIFILILCCQSQNVPTVSTRSGKILGYYKTSYEGNKYKAFEGIPYAKPPLGGRRFEPPEPIEPWSGEFLANTIGERCVEFNIEDPRKLVQGAEDCLKLNVYVPTNSSIYPLPVLFWIHDGAFQYGHALPEAPYFLIDHNVIFVSIQYRLGSLGFLSTEDDVVPGNMGLKDQSVALKWVNNNIEFFGGDSNRITLVGLSAGGASVHYHYLSPMSAGLFHSGISFSGTALVPWAQAENSREKAFQLGKIMGCPTNSSYAVIQCLKKQPAISLVRAQQKFMPWRLNPFTPFGPVAEKSSNHSFITRSPIEIINSGDIYDVPWVTGVVSDEGLFPTALYIENPDVLKEMNENWDSVAPHLLDYYYTIPKEQHASVAQKIRKEYLNGQLISKRTLKKLINMVSDRLFNVDAEKSAKAQAKVSQSAVKFYYYSYRASSSLSNTTENLGVCHGDDVYLVIGNEFMSPVKSKKDMAMLKDLIDIWTSAAINGSPQVREIWERIDIKKSQLNYLHIAGPGDSQADIVENFGRKDFWSTIDFNENKITRY